MKNATADKLVGHFSDSFFWKSYTQKNNIVTVVLPSTVEKKNRRYFLADGPGWALKNGYFQNFRKCTKMIIYIFLNSDCFRTNGDTHFHRRISPEISFKKVYKNRSSPSP